MRVKLTVMISALKKKKANHSWLLVLMSRLKIISDRATHLEAPLQFDVLSVLQIDFEVSLFFLCEFHLLQHIMTDEESNCVFWVFIKKLSYKRSVQYVFALLLCKNKTLNYKLLIIYVFDSKMDCLTEKTTGRAQKQQIIHSLSYLDVDPR